MRKQNEEQTQEKDPGGRPPVLDEKKRQQIIVILANGSSCSHDSLTPANTPSSKLAFARISQKNNLHTPSHSPATLYNAARNAPSISFHAKS